jgi:hypothetical protein
MKKRSSQKGLCMNRKHFIKREGRHIKSQSFNGFKKLQHNAIFLLVLIKIQVENNILRTPL